MRDADAHEYTTTGEIVALLVVAGGTAAAASQTDHVAPILTFAGALIVAVLTAVTTSRRQDRSITAERGRQDRALAAEGARQSAQLRHDRALADLTDLRALLDDGSLALHRAGYAVEELWSALHSFGRKIGEHKPETIPAVFNRGREVEVVAARLAVRLLPDAVVVQAFRAAEEELLAIARTVAWLEDDTRATMREKTASIQAAAQRFTKCQRAYEQAAVHHAGTQLGQGSPVPARADGARE